MKERHYQRYLARKRKRQQEGWFGIGWEAARAADSPIHECLVPEGLFEQGIGNLVFSRVLPDGRIALAAFLLDVFCLGAKNAFFATLSRSQYEERLRHWPEAEHLQPISPACFRKLVEGGVAYARELGFNPHADYAVASAIFGKVDAAACGTRFEYGREGKPFYIAGPNETEREARAIVEHLERRLGPGKSDFLITLGEQTED